MILPIDIFNSSIVTWKLYYVVDILKLRCFLTLCFILFQVEDCKMTTVSVRSKASAKFLNINGIKATHFDPGDNNQNCSLPPNTIPFENQVAGHSFGDGKDTLGNCYLYC